MSILANISKISERLLVWQITECFNLFHPNVPFLYSSWKAWDSTRMEHALAWNGLMIYFINIWVKVFKNGPSKIFGRQPLKNLKWYGEKAVFHKFYLVHSWIPWPICYTLDKILVLNIVYDRKVVNTCR